MKRITYLFFFLLIGLFTSCALQPVEGDDNLIASDEIQSPDETSLGDEFVSELSIVELLEYERGYFDLNVTLNMEAEQVCTAKYPFTIRMEGDRILLTGETEVLLACALSGRICGETCRAVKVLFDFNTRIDGEILLDPQVPQNQTLEIYYFYDGVLKEFYTEVFEGSSPVYTEEFPLEMGLGDLKPAVVPFLNGVEVILMGEENVPIPDELPLAIEHAVWRLTLHLQ